MKILLVFFLVFPIICAAQPEQFTRSTMTVMAWNLAGFERIPRERVPNFVPAVRDMDAEVLALVEVNTDWVPAELAAELNDLGVCYKRKIIDQSASQNIALLHKCNVEESNVRLVPDSNDGRTRLRKALAADVKVGEFDFMIIVLHLKAGRDSSSRATRDRQNQILANFITNETNGAERDVLVVGDYNIIPGQDNSNFTAMNPTGFLDFVSSDDLQNEFSHIHDGGTPGSLLDGFAVSEGYTAEYIGGSLRIYPMHRALGKTLEEYHDEVSDHLPLVASFRITIDDD